MVVATERGRDAVSVRPHDTERLVSMLNQCTTKRCIRCALSKPIGEFHRDKARLTGRRDYCRDCERLWRRTRWKRTTNRAEYNERHRLAMRRWRATHPRQERAGHAVRNAMRGGLLVKPLVCSSCGDGGLIHGHHDNYSELLGVRWLCDPCHKMEHRRDLQ